MPLAVAILTAGSGLTNVADFVDGSLLTARFNSPWGMCPLPGADDEACAFYVADFGNLAIRKVDVTNDEVSTVVVLPYNPTHISLFANGDLLVSTRRTGDVNCPLYRVTPSGTYSYVGQTRQPRGNYTDGSSIWCMVDGFDYFGEQWVAGTSKFAIGATGNLVANLGIFEQAEGLTRGPDGRFYGLCYNGYYYNTGSGIHVFNADGSYYEWAEGIHPGQGDLGGYAGRVQMAYDRELDTGLQFYATAWDGIHRVVINNVGKRVDLEIIYQSYSPSGPPAAGLCIVGSWLYFTSTYMYPGQALGGVGNPHYFYPGGLPHTGQDSVYRVALPAVCLPHPTVVTKNPTVRIVLDEQVATLRAGRLRGAPKVPITGPRVLCEPSPTATTQKPSLRLRERTRR